MSSSSSATTTSITLQHGVDSYTMQDTYMRTDMPNANEGGHGEGIIGSCPSPTLLARALQRWDLSDIPAGAIITSATLSLYDTNSSLRTANCTFNIYKISDANGDWVEGTKEDATGGAEPTWNYKVQNASTAWAGSAGLSTSGTDFINTSLASGTFTDGSSGFKDISLNSDGIDVLESWCGSSGGNGWLIVGD